MEKHIMGENGISYTLGADGLYYPDLYLPEETEYPIGKYRIKFKEGIEPERIILSYYNSISFAFTEICGRSYGGGVLEILPGEVGKVLVPVLDCVPLEKVREVLHQVDQIVRNGENIEKALDIVDNGILKEYLGIDEKMCSMSRGIWKKMQHRRLKRG